MNASTRRLPDAELDVMQAVWLCTPPAARADIEIFLNNTHPMAPTRALSGSKRRAAAPAISLWCQRRIIWRSRETGFSASSAAAACPPLHRLSATAASVRRS